MPQYGAEKARGDRQQSIENVLQMLSKALMFVPVQFAFTAQEMGLLRGSSVRQGVKRNSGALFYSKVSPYERISFTVLRSWRGRDEKEVQMCHVTGCLNVVTA
jgi:hypothetical protein